MLEGIEIVGSHVLYCNISGLASRSFPFPSVPKMKLALGV